MTNKTICVIGAGLAGLAAARGLQTAGHQVVVIDKGRTVGGRVATRISRDGHRFDHGAQYISAKTPAFQAVLDAAQTTGAIADWEPAPGLRRSVGAPGMVSFPQYLSAAIKVHQGVEVTSIRAAKKGWTVVTTDNETHFDIVVLTVPAPQAARLLEAHAFAEPIAAVQMDPCLTVMAAFDDRPGPDFTTRRDPDAPLSWIARDSDKPGRMPGHRFVGQASVSYSSANLEADKPDIAALLLPELCDVVGRNPQDVTYLAGHRWRYARTATPLGLPFLVDGSRSLFVGGDWCLGARVEAAWESGAAIAEAIAGATG